MVVALLVLIVLILLFGAAVVRGWIANAVSLVFGLLALALALIWVGSFLGEDGVLYILITICGIMLVLAVLKTLLPSLAGPASILPLEPKPKTESAERVWRLFAHDIAHRFSPDARDEAHRLYEAGETRDLERFCRRETQRLK